MIIDARKVIDRLKNETGDRGRVVMYLSKALFKDFQKSCKNVGLSASKVSEELFKEFIESTSTNQVESISLIPQEVLDQMAMIDWTNERAKTWLATGAHAFHKKPDIKKSIKKV